MQINKGNSVLLAILTFANVTFAFILIVQLRTTPAEVFEKVQALELNISMQIAEVKAIEKHTNTVLDNHKLWISDLSDIIVEISKERWRQEDTVKTWAQIFETNPTLKKPDKFLPETIVQPPLILPKVPE